MGSEVLLAQCPAFPNGDMELQGIDSIEYNSKYYYINTMAGWESPYGCHIFQSENPDTPDVCTVSSRSYDGKLALKVPLESYLFLELEAFKRDTISGVPNGIQGQFFTDQSIDSLIIEFFIFFHNSPTTYLYQLDSLDSFKADNFYKVKLQPTLGKYQPFEILFNQDQVETDSFIVYIYGDAEEADVNLYELDVLFDNLEFSCASSSKDLTEIVPFEIFSSENGEFILKNNEPSLETQYEIYNLNGVLLERGVFTEQQKVYTKNRFQVLTLKNEKAQKVMKIPPVFY